VFGCGDGDIERHLTFAPALAQAAYGRSADRLRHTDGLDSDLLQHFAQLRTRLGAFASSVLGGGGGSSARPQERIGRVHVLPSTDETVRLGVFDSNLPNVLEIDSGDVVIYPDTWSHFLNRMQPGVSIDDLAQLRRENRGRGPHSIVGPVGVRDAAPGDMLEIEFQRLIPTSWGATFVNPADLNTGTLPDQFPNGQIKYLQFELEHMRAEFAPGIHVPLQPFQGTVGVAPIAGGTVSSVPPGQHAGNIDLRDLTEGTLLYIPVWQAGAKLFTGDSHAAQGDGEVNNQAIETAMQEVRLRIRLHMNAGWAWPFAETDQYWIAMGIDADLNEAFRIATRNVIAFLERRAGLAPIDGYSLASIAVSFRVTQFVNQVRGVHAMIPKALFSAERRATMSIVQAMSSP
jgi:acetamidase/formamidase